MKKSVAVLYLILGLGVVWGLREMRLRDAPVVLLDTPPPSHWKPELFRMSSFGHLAAVVDWLWLRTLQDTSIYHVPRDHRATIYYLYDLLTDLDPLFYAGYVAGAKMLAVIRDDVYGARDLLLKAAEFEKTAQFKGLPENFKPRFWIPPFDLPLSLGYIYLFELDDLTHATEWFIEASRRPDVPEHVKGFANRLQKPGGVYEVGIRLVDLMILSEKNKKKEAGSSDDDQGTQEDRIISELEIKRRSLFVMEYTSQMSEAFTTFLKSKSEYTHGVSFSKERMRQFWDQFVRKAQPNLRDPFGGKVYLSDDGRVVSTTPVVPVLGIKQ